jgi:DNA polymerase I
MAKSLYIIDGHAHIYAAYYAPMRPLTSPAGEPTKATYIFTTAILGLLERQKPDMLVVAMDCKGKSFRSGMYAEYKAHRPPMPEDMPAQIRRIEQILTAMRIPIVRVEGFEADDVIGTLATEASRQGIDCRICSKDKDMLQLLDEHVSLFDLKSGQVTTPETLKAETGLEPGQFVDVLALQGDAADNVPGVADVGPKTAIAWIREYRSLENLLANIDAIGGKRGENLRNSREILELSHKLVIIDRAAPVRIDEKEFAVKEPDKEALGRIFSELDFTRLIGSLGLTRVAIPTAQAPARGQGDLFSGLGDEESKPAASSKAMTSAATNDKTYHCVDTADVLEKLAAELRTKKLIAVDTETTSTDPMRAELVGMSFSWQAGLGYYLPIKAPLGQTHLDLAEVRRLIGPILADEKIQKVGQNIKYDLIVLGNAGLPVAGIAFDTMVASYCLSADRMSHSMDSMARDYLGYETITLASLIGKGKNQLTFDMVDTAAATDYAAEDADITWRLYEYLSPRLTELPRIRELFEKVEMPLMEVLAGLERNGVFVEAGRLRKLGAVVDQEIDQLVDAIYKEAGTTFNIDSTKQLGEILFDRLGLKSVRSGKTMRSTDAEVLEELQDEHPVVALILQYRQLVKLKNTYLDKLGQIINPRTGRIHASFNQTVTATGRLSSSDPNLQNIPVRTELGKKIRSAFVAQKDSDCLLSADYSQIELRLLAHFSADPALRKAFAEDQDIHRFVAAQVYGVRPELVSGEMRSRAKAVNFGIIYGQGAFGLSRTTGMSQAEAKKFIEDYFARYGSIRAFMDRSIEQVKLAGFAETMLGRRRPIVGLNSKNFNVRSQGQRLAINTIIQGSAADLIKVAMINIQRRIDRDKLPIRMILQVHDELVFELPQAGAEEHGKWIAEEMASAIRFEIPIKVDVTIGHSWLGDK